jgi:hypothetical protein
MKKENTKTQKAGVGVITTGGGGMGTNSKSDSSDMDPAGSIGSSGGATPTHAPVGGDGSENGPGSAPGSAAPKDSLNDDASALNGDVGGNLNDAGGDHKTPDSCPGNATPSSHCDGGVGAPPSVPSGSQVCYLWPTL